uniref:Uncharacterized protein n=1 Tax=Arundo donax TaxID=35708 RepID=A0A0A9AUZ9_ARUDO
MLRTLSVLSISLRKRMKHELDVVQCHCQGYHFQAFSNRDRIGTLLETSFFYAYNISKRWEKI